MQEFALRDCLSVTGVNCIERHMAVGPGGQIIFKRSPGSLQCYDVQELSASVLQLSKKDPLFDDCQIYDIAFLRNGSLLLCLLRPATNELFICAGTIDSQELRVDISGSVHRTKMATVRGRHVHFVQDEVGVVLVSYPIKWNVTGHNILELFHASNFIQANGGDKYTITLTSKQPIDATFGEVFISRNHLYLFYGHDYNKFLLVPLAGISCGKCEVRTADGFTRSQEYVGKTVQVFEDFVLVYAFMNIRNLKPTFHMLNLTNLRWYPVSLTLSHHFPNAKVSFQKAGEEMIFLHGDCNIGGCKEKSHLYQISLESIMNLPEARPRSKSVNSFSSQHNLQNMMNISQNSTPILQRAMSTHSTPPTSPVYSSTTSFPARADAPIVHRYKKKQGKEDLVKKRYSASATSQANKSSSSISDERVDDMQLLKRTPSCSSLHWCADMAEQTGLSLQEQLKLAHEMGYSEENLLAALNMNQKNNEGPYDPFSSTNYMLDVLNQVSGPSAKDQSKMKLSVYNEKPNGSTPRPAAPQRSASVSRSSSFHIGSRPTRSESHDLSRLITTLEREKERDKKEVDQQFSRLKTRIHELERERDQLNTDNERYTGQLETMSSELETSKEQLSKLEDEMRNKDQLEIEKLRIEKDLVSQKELAEHRRKNFEEKIQKKEEEIHTLKEQNCILAEDLARKKALLDEQTDIARRMEERNSRNSVSLLGEIESSSRRREELQRQANELMKEEVNMYRELLKSLPAMEETMRKLETELEANKSKWKDEKSTMRREINQLMDKTTSECCICLTTKPGVVFLPCRHLTVCSNCVEESNIKECPQCRSAIEDTLKIFT